MNQEFIDFVGGLTEEQKGNLKKLLDEGPKYRVEFEIYENGNLRYISEYLGDLQHGRSIAWYKNGVKWWEHEYCEGQLHGKSIDWYENGQIQWEAEY